MADIKDENEIILNELKEKIKTLSVPERKKAVALYSLFKQIIEEVKKEQALNDEEYNKYNEVTALITTQMDEIIEGKRSITDAEIECWKQEEPTFVNDANINVAEPIKGFWKGFLINADFYHGDCDAAILEHLEHIEAKTEEDEIDGGKKIITLTFGFSDNNFFENKELWVKLHSEHDAAVRSEASEIKWKNNPTVEKTQKKQKNKRSGQTRVINKEVQKTSFFEIFNKYEADDEEEENDDKNHENDEGSMNLYILEETVNDILDMMPYALEYYLNVRPDEDDEGKTIEEEEEDDDEDHDDDNDDDKDEDEDDDERHKFKSRKSSEHQGSKKTDKNEKQSKQGKEAPKQECKQQ